MKRRLAKRARPETLAECLEAEQKRLKQLSGDVILSAGKTRHALWASHDDDASFVRPLLELRFKHLQAHLKRVHVIPKSVRYHGPTENAGPTGEKFWEGYISFRCRRGLR